MQASKDTETTLKRVFEVKEFTQDVVTLKMSPREAAQVHTIMAALSGMTPTREPGEVVSLVDERDQYGFRTTAQLVAQAILDAGVDHRGNTIFDDSERLG